MNSPELVFLHGFGTNSATWSHVNTSITAAYKCHFVDFLGYGAEQPAKTFHFTVDEWAEQIGSYVASSVRRPYGIIAHSLGGGICLRATRVSGIKPAFIVLVDPLLYPQRSPRFTRALGVPVVGGLLLKLVPPRVQLALAYSDIYACIARVPKDILRGHRKLYERAGFRSVIRRTFRNLRKNDLALTAHEIAQLKCALYLVYGTRDAVIPEASFERMIEDFHFRTVARIEDCGHAPQEECPDKFNACLESILEELRNES